MKTKKTISVILALIMLLSCSPVLLGTALAANITYDESFTLDGSLESERLLSGNTYTVASGVTVKVTNTVYIPANCTLTVAEGGTLDVREGSIVVIAGGTLRVDGNIIRAENVSGQGDKLARVRFPALSHEGLKDYVRVYYAVSESASAYEDSTSGFTALRVDDEGATIYAPLNEYLFIKADIVKDGDEKNWKYDDSLMKVFLDNVEMPYAAEYHRVKLQDAGDVTYSKWVNDDAFLRTFRISLTSGKGYTVIGRDGEEGTALVKYGSPFKFRLEIDDDYQMSGSTAEVYIYNGYGVVNYDYPNTETVKASTPDAEGYYTIPAVINDYTVYVSMLGIDDPTVTQVGGILQTVRSIFEMIINFFRQIANIFKIGG